MKAKQAQGIVRAALDSRTKRLGYSGWDDFLASTGLEDENLSEVVWIMRDMVEPYVKEKREIK